MVLVNRLWPRSRRELPYRLYCFLRFVLDRLLALRWLGGFGRAARLLDRLRALRWLGGFGRAARLLDRLRALRWLGGFGRATRLLDPLRALRWWGGAILFERSGSRGRFGWNGG